MKYYIVSDIHGSSKSIKKVLEYFDQDGDYLLVLGDILYHGPRNEVPENYEPKTVIQLLNERKDKILAVRGNCDGEVDQMVLNFPITSDYLMLPFDEYKIFMTHGHLYKEFLLTKIAFFWVSSGRKCKRLPSPFTPIPKRTACPSPFEF